MATNEGDKQYQHNGVARREERGGRVSHMNGTGGGGGTHYVDNLTVDVNIVNGSSGGLSLSSGGLAMANSFSANQIVSPKSPHSARFEVPYQACLMFTAF